MVGNNLRFHRRLPVYDYSSSNDNGSRNNNNNKNNSDSTASTIAVGSTDFWILLSILIGCFLLCIVILLYKKYAEYIRIRERMNMPTSQSPAVPAASLHSYGYAISPSSNRLVTTKKILQYQQTQSQPNPDIMMPLSLSMQQPDSTTTETQHVDAEPLLLSANGSVPATSGLNENNDASAEEGRLQPSNRPAGTTMLM